MAILSRYARHGAAMLVASLAFTCSASPGESPHGLNVKVDAQDSLASRALYEYEYVQWFDRRPRIAPPPLSDKVRQNLIKMGNTEADIQRYQNYRANVRNRLANEHWEKGTIVIRRLGDIVSVEKRTIATRYAGETWRTVETARRDARTNIDLRGVKAPAGGDESVIRDYSNGKLTSTVGRIGPSGRIDADIDREDTYRFPSTIGSGAVAMPLAGLPISKFCLIDKFRKQSEGIAWAARDVIRDGHSVRQTFEVDTKSGKLMTFTESVDKKPYYTIDVDGYQSVNGGVLVAKKVDVRFLTGAQSVPSQQISYELKRSEFGDKVDVKDMKSMGPVGTQALDNRLKGPKSVPYVLGAEPKTDSEVRQIAGESFFHEAPQENRPTQLVLIGSGGVMVAGAAALIWRTRRRSA